MADDRAQYAIDIATRLTGGNAAIDQLDSLTASLMGGGKEADFFSEALASVDSSLRAAAAATELANSSLAAGTAHYGELESAALQAAKAAEKAALKNGGLIPPELFAEQEKAKAALEAHSVALKGLEGAAKLAKEEESRLGGVQRNLVKVQGHVAKSLASTAEQSGKLKEAIGAVGGPLGGLAQKAFGPIDSFNKLSQTFGASKAAGVLLGLGLVAVVAGVVALSVAAAAGIVSITSWGVSLADTARNADIATEAFQAAHPAITDYASAADAASAATGLTDQAIQGLAAKLEKAKVSAADFPAALEAAAIAEQALGSGGADKFLAGIQAGSESVKSLAADTKASLGGIVSRQMLSLGAQSARLKKNLGETFGGLGIDPLLEGIQTLGKLFDADTESGTALKTLFNDFFQPLVDGFTNAIPAIESFFLGIEIGALKLAIFLKPALRSLKEAFGFEDASTEETLASMAKAGEVVAYAIAGVAAGFAVLAAVVLPVVAVGLAAIAAAVVVAGGALTALYLLGYYTAEAISEAFTDIADAASALWDGLSEAFSSGLAALSAFAGEVLDVGKDIALGLAQGIINGGSAIIDALTGAVRGAIDSAKHLLGIASPSKVFAEIGDNTIAGYSMGIDDAAPMAHASVEDALEPPKSSPLRAIDLSNPANRPSSGSASVDNSSSSSRTSVDNSSSNSSTSNDNSRSINLSNLVFNFHGVEGAEDAEQTFRTALSKILSGELNQAGGVA